MDFQKKAIDNIIEKREEERKAEVNSRNDECNKDGIADDIPANPGEEWYVSVYMYVALMAFRK